MDNHDSHTTLEVIKLARENQVELLGLPPHTTHILQPLDVGINGPLKAKVSAVATSLGYVNNQETINKAKFPTVLSYSIDQFCSPANVKAAFRKSGLYPVDPDAIDKTQVMPSQFPSKPASEHPSTSEDNQQLDIPLAAEAEQSHSPADVSSSTCDKCGSFLGGNPLVRQGLVPQHLSAIFPAIPAKPQTTKRRCVSEARVITSDAFYQQIVDKAEETERRKQETEKRKRDREARKKEKEENKKRSRKQKKDVCGLCMQVQPPRNDDDDDDQEEEECEDSVVEWIECDMCSRWYHQACVGLEDQEDVEDLYFICCCCSGTSADQ